MNSLDQIPHTTAAAATDIFHRTKAKKETYDAININQLEIIRETCCSEMENLYCETITRTQRSSPHRKHETGAMYCRPFCFFPRADEGLKGHLETQKEKKKPKKKTTLSRDQERERPIERRASSVSYCTSAAHETTFRYVRDIRKNHPEKTNL
jgi:hypothetical protein